MIINSMFDNDVYKFTMLQAVLHQHSKVTAEYKFKCRTENINFLPYIEDIKKGINDLTKLKSTKEELEYAGDMRFIESDTIQFLKLFRFDNNYVNVYCDTKGALHVTVRGPWLHTILFEVPILSIISEIYSRDQTVNFDLANRRTEEKINLLLKTYNDTGLVVPIDEFGGRRRHSLQAHKNALSLFKEKCFIKEHKTGLVGTSNMMLAKELGITPIGTMAHEWMQAHQSLYRVADSQSMALENWAREYRGDLGIALSDVIGLKYFLYDFDMYFSKLFDGSRQDSGCPYRYADSMIEHYESMNIDPKTKTVVFSDGLTIEEAINLAITFAKKIKTSFGIGTFITNDFDFKALQLVLKMTECNGNPVAKISDSPGKSMCKDNQYVNYLIQSFDRRINRK